MKSRVEGTFPPESQPIEYPYIGESKLDSTKGLVVLVTGEDQGVVLVAAHAASRYQVGYVFDSLDEETLTRVEGSIVVKFTND